MPTHDGPIIAERDGLRVVECRECGYAHLSGFPKSTDLETYYTSEFWEKDKLGELALYEDRRAWWAMTHADWLSRLEHEILGRTLLDVGCGYGFFMHTAQARGWHTLGFELSKAACGYASKLCNGGLWCGNWENRDASGSAPEKFDAISALWLIEHLPDPPEFLKWCHDHLYSSGALLIVCPNEWTRAQTEANEKVEKKCWWVDKTHLNYFNIATLGNLLGRAGFQVVEWLSTETIENFIGAGDGNYVDNPELGPRLHHEIEELDMLMKQSDRIGRATHRARRGEGRDIVSIARVDA